MGMPQLHEITLGRSVKYLFREHFLSLSCLLFIVKSGSSCILISTAIPVWILETREKSVHSG